MTVAAAGTTSSTQAMPVVRVAQSSLLRLRMPVPESDVHLIRVGSPVTITVQAVNRTVTAPIVRFTRSLDEGTRTMIAEVDIKNPDLSLSPGMYADTQIVLEQHKDALGSA